MEQLPERDIIVIGGSAGAIEPLLVILRELPADLPAAVFVVIHVAPDAPPELVQALVTVGALSGAVAANGQAIEYGRVLIAPPNRHLLIRTDEVSVTRGPHENRVRPAIDPMFRTAAKVFDGRVIAVILSGGQNDGTYGAMMVNSRGGVVIVQDPTEAQDPGMPSSALTHARVDYVEKATDIARRIQDLVWSRPQPSLPTARTPLEAGPDEMELVSERRRPPEGTLSPFICPECKGPLWLSQDGSFSHFRCHEGHAFSGEVLAAYQGEDLEAALWSAVRSLDEHAALLRRLAATAPASVDYTRRANESESKARLIREKLLT
jgi:two-component system, chemotaxis family, protein-glutamate methylesterase/glutaminase